jgi:hypothetical protein
MKAPGGDGEEKKKVRVGVWTPEDFQDIKVRTGQSSIAGAGSGEFHMYNDRTRRERERLAKLQEQDDTKRAREQFESKQEELRRADEEKTAKNRNKRAKRKQSKKKGGGGEDGEGIVASAGNAAGGATFVARGNVADKEEALGAGVRARLVQRTEGEAERDWQTDGSCASCAVSVEGYVLYKFRDVAGDVRESMATRGGDYVLMTAGVPHVWEAVSAARLLLLSVQQAVSPAVPAFVSGYAPQHEGAFFAGPKSLAPESTLRKSFPADLCYSALAAAGDRGKGVAGLGSQTAVLLVRGKASVACAGETGLLSNPGDFVVCPAFQEASWTALAPTTLVVAVVLPRY